MKTAMAAEIAGIGYEGFRTWLKRGLLKSTGALPIFYAPDAPAELADAKRWRWSVFGFADLCSFRLTKTLLDAGLPWEVVNSIVSDERLWRSHRQATADSDYLAVFPKQLQWTLYGPDTLAAALTAGTIKSEWMILVSLQDVRQSVIYRTGAAALRTIANQVKRTALFSARSGSNALSPDEQAARQDAIKTLADRIHALATETEQGSGSHQQFEEIMRNLHQLGIMIDDEALSIFTATCV